MGEAEILRGWGENAKRNKCMPILKLWMTSFPKYCSNTKIPVE
jgi:hypothetical protein